MNKQAARSALIKKRKALSPEAVQWHSQQLTQHFLKESLINSVQHIACYLSVHNEIDPCGIIEILWRAKKTVYLPVLAQEKKLCFVRYVPETLLSPNQYGILEPKNSDESISVADLELVLLPLVAFDRRGHRVGMGQGYYDRTFSVGHRAALIGLGYSWQKIDDLEMDAWDVPLTSVLTDQGLFVPCL